jgi:hypothetical protein
MQTDVVAKAKNMVIFGFILWVVISKLGTKSPNLLMHNLTLCFKKPAFCANI